MANERMRILALLGDSRGQSWVETVVMLPVIVGLLLGLFYLHDLVTTKIRAIQAARFVAWESTWYAREDNDNRRMTLDTTRKLKNRLSNVGLGRGLKHADVFKRPLGTFKSNVGPGVASTMFLPCALQSALQDVLPGECGADREGADQSQGFIENIAGSLSDVLSGLANVAGDAAFFFQGFQAQNTNWETELNESVYTARVVYDFGYTGFFANFGTATIVERGSVVSHPYAVKRSNDDKEHSDLLGNPCLFDDGHVYKLWLMPQQIPPIQGAEGITGALNGVLDVTGDIAKCAISGPGQLLGFLDIIGADLGFTMPSGTTKEYPELNMPTNSGSSSGSGSGSSLGDCEEGGGGAMGSGTTFSGCS